MHGGLICGFLLLALGLRWGWHPQPDAPWSRRWRSSLMALAVPPLLLLSASMAVLAMGCHGSMLGLPVAYYGCWLAAAILGFSLAALLVVGLQGVVSVHRLRRYPTVDLGGYAARQVPRPEAVAAQVGFWQPQLVVSSGLLDCLEPQELQAVLAHEQAHAHFRDTFWFFWLGWLRRLTCWLPRTEALWQELRLLREMRADRWASRQVDSLELAEVLVKLVRHSQGMPSSVVSAACQDDPTHLHQRIEALIERPAVADSFWHEVPTLLGLLPLATIWLHG